MNFVVTVYAGVPYDVEDTISREDDVAEFFHSLNGFEDLEPGKYPLTL